MRQRQALTCAGDALRRAEPHELQIACSARSACPGIRTYRRRTCNVIRFCETVPGTQGTYTYLGCQAKQHRRITRSRCDPAARALAEVAASSIDPTGNHSGRRRGDKGIEPLPQRGFGLSGNQARVQRETTERWR